MIKPGHNPDQTPFNLRLSKRDFLKYCGAGLGVCSMGGLLGFPRSAQGQAPRKGLVKTKLSPYFSALTKEEIRCDLCPFNCRVAPGKRGRCRARENRQGRFYSLVYGNPCSAHLDPIEKKPFFHFLPASSTFSIATAGCNFRCKFCQNWEMSQVSPEDVYNMDFPPELVVKKATEMKARSIAYTYVEPTVFYEYMWDTGQLARKAGLANVYHSNGFINPEPLRNLCKILDGANIDLKGFTEDFYRQLCGGELAPVLKSLKILKEEKVHLEITNLVIPTMNDDLAKIRELCLWIKNELGPETPIHFSRFYPLYKLKALPPTPVSTLDAVRATAQAAGLDYVYIGNIPGHVGENTFCPRCRQMIIKRTGFMVGEVLIREGKCGKCGQPIPGVWG